MSHAIENGMKQTMVTFHVIDEGTDTGPVVMKVPVNIRKKDTAWTLYNRCTSMAFGAFRDNWGMLKLKPPGEPQKSLGSYYTRDLDNELFLYEWQKRFIRSRTFPDKPCPYLVIDGRRVEL
jgi:methionyl-tRNA formyltransferase